MNEGWITLRGIGRERLGRHAVRAAGVTFACLGLLVVMACKPAPLPLKPPQPPSPPIVKIIQPTPNQTLISTLPAGCGQNTFEATATAADGTAITDPNQTEWRLTGGNPAQNLLIGKGLKGIFPADVYGPYNVVFTATDPANGAVASAQVSVYVAPCVK